MKKKIVLSVIILILITLICANDKVFAESTETNNGEIWYTEHSTQKHTKRQIVDKYKSTLPKYDYSKNQFSVQPSAKAPYVAGKLQTQVVTDTINQINYYRWLYGVNDVTVNSEKLDRNQKGAVVQAATDELTHTPTRPSDMSEEFFKEAYAGCYADYDYNGNCSYGDRSITDTIEGYISDLYNISSGSYIGHRLNLLDLKADKASFGYCNYYSTLSMYYGTTNNKEKFYAYPSAGNFPMQNFVTNEYWHLNCTESYNLKNMKIEFIYNGKTYTQKEYGVERTAIVFKMPDELINIFGGNGRQMKSAKITVKLTGLTNTSNQTVNYKYDVNFFDLNEILITNVTFAENQQTGYNGIVKVAQNIKIMPTNNTENNETIWSSSNESIATIDKNGKITCKANGTTTISAKIGDFTASYTLTVKQAPPYTIGHVNDDGKVNTLDAVRILQYVAKKVTLTEAQMLAADTNKDGRVNTLDAVRILQFVAKKIPSL